MCFSHFLYDHHTLYNRTANSEICGCQIKHVQKDWGNEGNSYATQTDQDSLFVWGAGREPTDASKRMIHGYHSVFWLLVNQKMSEHLTYYDLGC